MTQSAAPVIAVYRFKSEVPDAEIHDLLRRHRAALVRGRFTTERTPYVLRSLEDRRVFVEVFDWRSEDDARRANADPLVRAVWDEFASRCETVGVPLKDLPESQRPFCHFESFPVVYELARGARARPAKKKAAARRPAAKKPAAKKAAPRKAAAPPARKPARRAAPKRR